MAAAQIVVVLGPRTRFLGDLLAAVRRTGHVATVFAPGPLPACGADAMDRAERIRLDRPDDAVALAARLHEELPIAGVIGLGEDTVLLAARVATKLGLPSHPVEACEAALDKPTMKRLLAEAGVPIAEHVVAADEDDAVRWSSDRYPVVVKPCQGCGSQGVMRADDEAELRQAYRRLRRIVRDYALDTGGRPEAAQLVERYLDGDEITVELIVQDGVAAVATVFEKPQPLTGPYFEETVYLTPPRIGEALRREAEELAVRAAAALGLRHGPAHCEIRLTPDGPVVLEIAARLIGGPCAGVFRHRLVDDPYEALVRLAIGQPVAPPRAAPDAPVAAAVMLPVPARGRVVAVHGVDRAARVPGIRSVTVFAGPGDVLVPFPEPSCHSVGSLSATGPTHEAVEDAVCWASASIRLELAPVECDRWWKTITEEDARYQPPPGFTVTTDADREAVATMLAEIVHAELPRPEALALARQRISCAAAEYGEPASIIVSGRSQAVLTSFVNGDTGIMCCLGVRTEDRRTGVGSILVRAQLAELARRGCIRAVSEVDSHLAAAQSGLHKLGFTLEARPPAPAATVVGCGLGAPRPRITGYELAGVGCCGG